VLKVDVGDRRYVTAGTVLIELDPSRYRTALAQARARAAALTAQVNAAQARLAAGRHQAAAGVTAAVGSASTMPPLPSLPPIAVPKVDAATKAQLAQAQQQIVAARTEVLSDAQSEAASARQTVDRDQALLAQGLIAAQQLNADTAAYTAAQGQVSAARTELRSAQAGALRAAETVAQAQAAIAAAQRRVSAAQDDAAAATTAVDRDKALVAQGAVAVRQITADTVTQDAAQARLQAATAELHRAQAELTAAQAEAVAAAAVRRQAQILQQAEAVRAQHAAQTRVLAQQAASTIATAAEGARALAALQTDAVNAQTAARRAEANLAETVVRAPAGGWVVPPIVRPGDSVRQGQSVAMLAAAAPAGATPGASQPRAGPAQLVQIAAGERQVLAELNAEAARISSISAAAIPEIPPRPGVVLSGLPNGGAEPFNQANGTVPTLLNGGMPWPILGPITSGFGWRVHPIFDTPEFHTGVDIAASMGAVIDAPAAGTVIFAGSLPANGTLVILDHGNGVTTTYSHLSAYRVYIGEHVRRGQVIARVGSTGWSTGPHLFFEIRKNGHPINPLSL
jgi:murein DD-endopeptidase MepM/ murein hydrolase activator NlpD